MWKYESLVPVDVASNGPWSQGFGNLARLLLHNPYDAKVSRRGLFFIASSFMPCGILSPKKSSELAMWDIQAAAKRKEKLKTTLCECLLFAWYDVTLGFQSSRGLKVIHICFLLNLLGLDPKVTVNITPLYLTWIAQSHLIETKQCWSWVEDH